MFTIKYQDQDGVERLTTGYDLAIRMDGKQAKGIGWLDPRGHGCGIAYPTIAYVMNESGATVAKYVVLGDAEARQAPRPFVPIAPEKRAGRDG